MGYLKTESGDIVHFVFISESSFCTRHLRKWFATGVFCKDSIVNVCFFSKMNDCLSCVCIQDMVHMKIPDTGLLKSPYKPRTSYCMNGVQTLRYHRCLSVSTLWYQCRYVLWKVRRCCRSVLGPKCLYTVYAVAGAWFIRTLQ